MDLQQSVIVRGIFKARELILGAGRKKSSFHGELPRGAKASP
jgi:hypothetical protein